MNIYVNSNQLSVILCIKRQTIDYYLFHGKLPIPCRKIDRRNHWEIGVVNKYIKEVALKYNLDIDIIRFMTKARFTRKAIGKRLGVPAHAVATVCQKHGIKSMISTGRKEYDRPSKAAKLFNTFLKSKLTGNK